MTCIRLVSILSTFPFLTPLSPCYFSPTSSTLYPCLLLLCDPEFSQSCLCDRPHVWSYLSEPGGLTSRCTTKDNDCPSLKSASCKYFSGAGTVSPAPIND